MINKINYIVLVTSFNCNVLRFLNISYLANCQCLFTNTLISPILIPVLLMCYFLCKENWEKLGIECAPLVIEKGAEKYIFTQLKERKKIVFQLEVTVASALYFCSLHFITF